MFNHCFGGLSLDKKDGTYTLNYISKTKIVLKFDFYVNLQGQLVMVITENII